MNTINILNQLIKQIQNHPEIITQLPWSDVQLCLLSEFSERKNLYDNTQFHSINEKLENLFLELSECINEFDYRKIIHLLSNFAFTLSFLPSIEHSNVQYEKTNYMTACLNHYQNDTVIVLGDSHVNFFSGNESLSFIPIGNEINTCITATSYPFTPLHLGPCLAYHCNTPNTTYRFKEKADYLFQNFIKPGAKVLVCLGEIDIRVHVFPQALKQNRPYTEIIDDILKEYLAFLCTLKDNGYCVSCQGPIASQKDTCPLDPSFPRNGSEKERNMATAYFNERLSELCAQNGIFCYSIFSQMITENCETIDDYFSLDRCHLGQAALPLAKPFIEAILKS